jgi:hypothetical protein
MFIAPGEDNAIFGEKERKPRIKGFLHINID